jgi:hypothetical protein
MDEVAIITRQCPFCKKDHSVPVPKAAYLKWQKGELLIQNAFPDLNADEREILQSGTCTKCWDAMFPEEF